MLLLNKILNIVHEDIFLCTALLVTRTVLKITQIFGCAQESLNCSFGKLEPIFLPPHAVSIPRTQVRSFKEHQTTKMTGISVSQLIQKKKILQHRS